MTSNQPVCPCCGGEVSPLDFLLDQVSRSISMNGGTARLTGKEYEFLTALLRAFPRVLSRADLMNTLYPNPNDAPDVKIIDVVACKLRKKLDPLGVAILTTWGVGYSLNLTSNDRAALARSKAFHDSRFAHHRAEEPDLTKIMVYREQGYPLTDIARRMGLTLKAVMVAVDSLAEQREARAA
jgi:DNA-binding winged helix-turn-helix (wHTH) protein